MTENLPQRIRRTYSPEFKAGIVASCQEPGNSVACVAMSHGINANLVHKWIRNDKNSKPQPQLGFIPVPTTTAPASDTITITIPTHQGSITIDWPVEKSMQSAQWLKEILS